MEDPLHLPVNVRRFVTATVFGSGALVGVLFYEVFVVKPKYAQLRKRHNHLAELVVASEKRVVYLAVLLQKHHVPLNEFDLIVLQQLV